MRIECIAATDINKFRNLVEEYWSELMPQASTMGNPEAFDAQFQSTFKTNSTNSFFHIAFEEDQPAGLFLYQIDDSRHQATISEFYVRPQCRRRGIGGAMVHCMLERFDDSGIEQIDLNVRRDNPDALAFWQAQGFGIALYRLRQLRDPIKRIALEGVLSSDFS